MCSGHYGQAPVIKIPFYSDVRYVESLIGNDTVNTLPDETIDAFADHGKLEKDAIENDVDEAQNIQGSQKNGIDVDAVTRQLEHDGIQKFIEPYNQLMELLLKREQKCLKAGWLRRK